MEVIIINSDDTFEIGELQRGILLVKDHEVVFFVDGRTTNTIHEDPFKDGDPLSFLIPDRDYQYHFELEAEPSRSGWTQTVKSQLFFPGVNHQPAFKPARNREYKSKSDDEY